MGFNVVIDGICQIQIHFTIPRYKEKKCRRDRTTTLSAPREDCGFWLRVWWGSEGSWLCFWSSRLWWVVREGPPTRLHDMPVVILSCAQFRVFCASEKYGKEYCFNHTYWSENFWGVGSPVRLFNGTDAPQKMIIRHKIRPPSPWLFSATLGSPTLILVHFLNSPDIAKL